MERWESVVATFSLKLRTRRTIQYCVLSNHSLIGPVFGSVLIARLKSMFTQSSELEAISREYASYFPSIHLIGEPPNSIEIKTTEGKTHRIKVNECGWSSDGTTTVYETFEALLGAISPGFRETFASDLFSRLQQLADKQGS